MAGVVGVVLTGLVGGVLAGIGDGWF